MKYLHIDEDGELYQTNSEPTQGELEAALNSYLTILRFENGFFERAEVVEEDVLVEGEDEESEKPNYGTRFKIDEWLPV